MRGFLGVLGLLFALSASASGQGNNLNGQVSWVARSTAPSGACSARQSAIYTPSGGVYTCVNGTWTLLSSGGGGGVSSVGLVGTANQITITGASPITSSGSWTVSIPTNPTLPGNTTGTFIGNITGNVTGNVSGTAPAGTLTGTTLAANVVSSSLTSVGTIATGVWSGTVITNVKGGTGGDSSGGTGLAHVAAGTWSYSALVNADITAATIVATTKLSATGTKNSTTFLRGDDTWAAPAGTGTVTVVGAGTLTSTACVTGGGSQTIQTPSATCTIDSLGNISTPGTITSGSGSGVAGGYQFLQGTASTPAANSIVLQAPTSVTTAYSMAFPSAAGTGFMLNTDSSNVDAITFVGFSGTGNVLRVASPTTTGTFTAAAITASGAFTNNGSYAGSAVVPTANIAVALANQTSIHGITAGTAAGDAVFAQVIAHGTTALDFASTATGACATVITATATGADTSKDVLLAMTSGSIKAVTGYVPASTGGFNVNPWLTTNTANFEACNWTAGTVDPGSITVNWFVLRMVP